MAAIFSTCRSVITGGRGRYISSGTYALASGLPSRTPGPGKKTEKKVRNGSLTDQIENYPRRDSNTRPVV